VPTRKEHTHRMIMLMGNICAKCGKRFHSDDLIIDHLAFDKGVRLGYDRSRADEVWHFARTGELPKDVQLLCDRCNRKRHGYRPSREDIFGDRL
jgi:5-methylcytosine-specific restriction endonuclease McrA